MTEYVKAKQGCCWEVDEADNGIAVVAEIPRPAATAQRAKRTEGFRIARILSLPLKNNA